VVRTTPGRVEVWELGNVGADSYLDIALDGHTFTVIERDGNPLPQPVVASHVFLPPASRAIVVVRIKAAGNYGIRTRFVGTGSAGDPNPNVVLATLIASGAPAAGRRVSELLPVTAAIGSRSGLTETELRALPVTRRRSVIYTENAAGTKFFLNGRAFDMNRIDVEVRLGDVEEWTLVNYTDERHTFHIHQLDYLVEELSGTNTLETKGLRDNVDIPFRDPVTRRPGIVKVKIPFTNPIIVGKFPFHCHILEHEDGGMMGNVVVRPR
jgi:FtsP/CotA-like multicopper oxidase with cupredoxin domain